MAKSTRRGRRRGRRRLIGSWTLTLALALTSVAVMLAVWRLAIGGSAFPGPAFVLTRATLSAAFRVRYRDLGAIAQPIRAVGHDALAWLQARLHGNDVAVLRAARYMTPTSASTTTTTQTRARRHIAGGGDGEISDSTRK